MSNTTVNRSAIPVLYSERDLAKLCMSNNKIFGLLARGVPATINTGTVDIGNLKGKYGESAIGSLLNMIALEKLDLYTFHSIANPNDHIGETDHIVIYKNKLILIETKTYNNFKVFKINKAGELRGRKVDQPKSLRKLDNNNLIEKVELYHKLFPDYSVHAITAVARAGVETYSENGKYKVASLDNLLQDIDYHITEAVDIPADITRDTIRFIASFCLNK